MPASFLAISQPGYPRTLFEKCQLVFLLSSFQEGTCEPKSNIKFGKNSWQISCDAKKKAEILSSLVQTPWFGQSPSSRAVMYGVTPPGIATKKRLEPLVLKSVYEARILFELASGKERSRTKKQLDELTVVISKRRDLLKEDHYRNYPTEIMLHLRDKNYIHPGVGDYQSGFALTDEGLKYLTTLELLPEWTRKFSGALLNDLFAAARSVSNPSTQSSANKQPASSPLKPGELRQAILDCFEKLRSEKYFQTGGVPIHEIRALIRERLGEMAASHEALDPEMKKLRSEGKFILVPLTMNPTVTPQQLADSIPGIHETLFFMVIAR